MLNKLSHQPLLFFSFLCFFNVINLNAQFNFNFEIDNSIALEKNNENLPYAWAGGLNNPQYNQADLNNDDIADLVIFDRSDNRVLTFLNDGASYQFAPEFAKNFPTDLNAYVRLYDYNCDGIEDLFTHFEFAVKVYTGFYSNDNQLSFELKTDKLTFGINDTQITIASPDYPFIGDIDNDNRIDILTFSDVVGGFVEWYKNVATNCNDFIFVQQDECWGNFFEDGVSTAVNLDYPTCGSDKSFENNNPSRHPGSTLLAIDLDNDQDKELIVGDINFDNVTMLTNGGTIEDAFMTAQDGAFPSYNQTIEIHSFPVTFAFDVNNDGIEDLLAAPNSPSAADHYNCSWMFLGENNDGNLTFNFQTKQFLNEKMIEVGRNAYPAEVDYDGDGLLDLVVGNYGSTAFNTSGFSYVASLTLYKNIGTTETPVYQYITNDWLSLSQLNLTGFNPTFGDINGDGAIDMICGLTGNNATGGQDVNGSLLYFENLYEAGQGLSFGFPTFLWQGIDVGQVAAPQIVDVNQDGLQDLLIGERLGKVHYYENIGTATEPAFEQISEFWGKIDVKDSSGKGFANPHLFKTIYGENTDSTWVLMVGANDGRVEFFTFSQEDIYNQDAIFENVSLTANFDFHQGTQVSPYLTSYNKILMGNFRGGLMAYNYNIEEPEDTTSTDNIAKLSSVIKIYPNPVSNYLKIETELPIKHVSILDVSGKLVELHQQKKQINTETLNAGIYLLNIELSNGITTTLKFVKD